MDTVLQIDELNIPTYHFRTLEELIPVKEQPVSSLNGPQTMQCNKFSNQAGTAFFHSRNGSAIFLWHEPNFDQFRFVTCGNLQ